jgi:hypothetical protein
VLPLSLWRSFTDTFPDAREELLDVSGGEEATPKPMPDCIGNIAVPAVE